MTQYSLGIDIGGTNIKGACISNGEIIGEKIKIPTPDDSEAIKNTVIKIIKELSDKKNISCIGVATAGVVNTSTGAVVSATENLAGDYRGTNFKDLISQEFSKFTFVENDANAAAYGEFKFGAGKGSKYMLMTTFGTGIGGGIIIKGGMYRGKSYAAGEFGHIPVSFNTPTKCTCGKFDCWEAYASGIGLNNYMKRTLEKNTGYKADISKLENKDLFEAVKNQDQRFVKIFDEWHLFIATGLIGLMNSFDPECIVVGGGLSKFMDFEKLQTLTKGQSPSKVRIVKAEMANNAGIIGVATLAEENMPVDN